MKTAIFTLGAALWLNACGESQFAGGQSTGPKSADASSAQWRKVEQTFSLEGHSRNVDVFFALDTSASMLDEQQAVEANMRKFLNDILESGIDVRVTALGSSSFHFPTDLPADRFAVVNRKIGSRDVLKILTDFFATGSYPLPLQSTSQVEVVIISDDDAYPTAGYRAADFRGPNDKKTVVNSIVGLSEGKNNADCQIERRGENHITLAQETGGMVLDLCTPNWDDLVGQLSNAIIARNRAFTLEAPPAMDREITVTVDDQTIDPSRYSIDAAAKTIAFTDDVIIAPTSIVKIVYFTPDDDATTPNP